MYVGKLETEAVVVRTRVRASDAKVQLLQMTYDNSTRQKVLDGEVLVEGPWGAELAVVLEPNDMKVAATLLELLEEALDRVDGMQQLESAWTNMSAARARNS